ncbi:MAG: hypothetical protein NTX49_03045 [Chlamydiae bacterium]|nr:hypothetical protein [Chlamydiota bacterium]
MISIPPPLTGQNLHPLVLDVPATRKVMPQEGSAWYAYELNCGIALGVGVGTWGAIAASIAAFINPVSVLAGTIGGCVLGYYFTGSSNSRNLVKARIAVDQDPLSNDVKKAICDFVTSHLVTNWTRDLITHPTDQAQKGLLDLSKTYKPVDPAYEAVINAYQRAIGHPERTLTRLHEAVKKPSIEAAVLGLTPQNRQQIYAAAIFMKAVIRNPTASLETIQRAYVRKITKTNESSGVFPITEKHKLIMNSPVCELSAEPKAIDILMANTYSAPTRFIPGESSEPLIRGFFNELLENKETSHVMHALAIFFQQQKGNILLSGSDIDITSHIFSSKVDGRRGCVRSHTIYLRGIDDLIGDGLAAIHRSAFSLINEESNIARPGAAMGARMAESALTEFKKTIVHEASHYVFWHIVGNDASPVSGALELELDKALAADRRHRDSYSESSADLRYQGIYKSLVIDLERSEHYFPGGFNPETKEHLHLMRLEAIVRIMEQVAGGVSLEHIQQVAPNLCKFYFTHSKPMIERYIEDHSSALPGINPFDVFTGTGH